MTTWLHERRLQAVQDEIRASRARSLLDLGCGDGDLIMRLIEQSWLERIVGVDICPQALDRLRARMPARARDRPPLVDLFAGSLLENPVRFAGFDCAALIETIEHIEPDRLHLFERAVLATMRPATVIVTTPNAEFNTLLGVPASRFRHRDHRFEWDRERFARWAEGVALRHGYEAACRDIAGGHPVHGGASQMAVFRIGR